MVTYRVVFTVFWAAMLLVGREIWTATAIPAHAATLDVPSVSATIPDRLEELRSRSEDVAEPRVDLFGNDVEEAVGDYRIDPRGDVYERHSPETEVPRLAPPVG
jgi:hypothetical protein